MWCLIVSSPDLCPLSYFSMVGAMCGSEITMIKRTLVFVQMTRINACLISSFFDFDHS